MPAINGSIEVADTTSPSLRILCYCLPLWKTCLEQGEEMITKVPI